MSVNAFKDDFYCAELFGEPVLYTNWLIQRETVPNGWFCYDLRGSEKKPQTPVALVNKTNVFHVGSILSPKSLLDGEHLSRKVQGEFNLLGEIMSMEQFCDEYEIPVPDEKTAPVDQQRPCMMMGGM